MEFSYKGYDRAGRVTRGTIETINREEAIRRLRLDGVQIFYLSTTGRARKRVGQVRLKDSTIEAFCKALAPLCTRHLPIDQALSIVASEGFEPRISKLAGTLRKSVSEGLSLVEALQALPEPPARKIMGVLRAGESSGSLGPALQRLGDALEREQQVGREIRSAMIYPGILLVTAIASILLILLVVTPSLEPVLSMGNASPPPEAKALVAVSSALRNWGIQFLLLAAIFAMLAVSWGRSPKGREHLSRMCLELPLLGKLIADYEAARLLKSLAMLLGAGVGLSTALGIAAEAVGNSQIRKSIEAAATKVREGEALGNAFLASGALTPPLARMVSVGEASGTLPELLEQSASVVERRAHAALTRISSLATPIMTLVMGITIGSLALIMLNAILSVNDMALQ